MMSGGTKRNVFAPAALIRQLFAERSFYDVLRRERFHDRKPKHEAETARVAKSFAIGVCDLAQLEEKNISHVGDVHVEVHSVTQIQMRKRCRARNRRTAERRAVIARKQRRRSRVGAK